MLKVAVAVIPPGQSCTVVVAGGFCTMLRVAAAAAVFLSSVLTLIKLPIRPPTRPLVMIARRAERVGVMTGKFVGIVG